jgi:hypothetical protein
MLIAGREGLLTTESEIRGFLDRFRGITWSMNIYLSKHQTVKVP